MISAELCTTKYHGHGDVTMFIGQMISVEIGEYGSKQTDLVVPRVP